MKNMIFGKKIRDLYVYSASSRHITGSIDEKMRKGSFISEVSLKNFKTKDSRCTCFFPQFSKHTKIGTVLNIAIGDPFIIHKCTLIAKSCRKFFQDKKALESFLSGFPISDNESFWVFRLPKEAGEKLIIVPYCNLCDAKHFEEKE